MKIFSAAEEWLYSLADFESELSNNRISKGKKVKEIIEEFMGEPFGNTINIILDNIKQDSSELDDETYYKFLGFSDKEQVYYDGPEGYVAYYLFRFETVE